MTSLRIAFLAGFFALIPPVAASDPAPPEVFSPGVISGPDSDIAPAFDPRGRRVVFSRSAAGHSSILVAKLNADDISPPRRAAFSTSSSDLEPAFSPDGAYLVFASDRPIRTGGTTLHAHDFGGDYPGGNLWRVDVEGTGWSLPRRLPDAINGGTSVWTPSIAANHDLFFMRMDRVTGHFRLHYAPAIARTGYGSPRGIAFSTGSSNDVDPMVDPGERFLIFSSDRGSAIRPGGKPGVERLYIAFHPKAANPLVCPIALPGWDDPGISEVESRLSVDLLTLYFSSSKSAHVRGTAPTDSWDNGKANIWMTKFDARLWQSAPGTSADCARAQIQADGHRNV